MMRASGWAEATARAFSTAKRSAVAAGCSPGKGVVGWLARHGATPGEELVRQANLHGYRPHDLRAFGPVFKRLLKQGDVQVLRSDLPRTRGHSSLGGKLYVRGWLA